MTLLTVGLVALWIAVAVVLALVIGSAIRTADRRESHQPRRDRRHGTRRH